MSAALGGIHSGVGTGRDNFSLARADSRVCAQFLELDAKLSGHTGCVNTIQWHADGQTLLTSGDDLDIRIWKNGGSSWYCKETIASAHHSNVFDVRSVDDSLSTLVSCAADGKVIATDVASTEAKPVYMHQGRAHKLAVRGTGSAGAGFVFLSAGEDGKVVLHDLRVAGGIGGGMGEPRWRSHPIIDLKQAPATS